jgi:alpha-ketoglutarate-dependent taurine dioxygenase
MSMTSTIDVQAGRQAVAPLQFKPLSKHIGSEVVGIDLRKGDLIVWDNRCSSHARTDFPADQRRLLLRTTVKGTCKPY